ncbi:MAG TPA: tetratricopeptide repeat protein [Vicinamibacteria bacterium]|jgi:tetratricopeptide (TPR) repeat protein
MKRLLVAGAVFASLSFAGGEVAAQTGTARGKVVDDKGQPVPEAQITIEYQGGVTRRIDVKSNKKGEFTQVGLAPGVYKVTATKDGYQGMFVEARISLGDPTYLPELKLVPRAAGAAAAGGEGAAKLQADFKAAAELMRGGKAAEAEAAFKALAVSNPNIPEVHYNIGYLAGLRQDWPAAEAGYLKALELKPSYGEAYVALSKVYRDSGRPDKAQEVMAKAAASSQGDAKVQYSLGVEHLNSGRSEEATAAFQKVIEIDPAYADAYFHLGTLAVGQNKIADAVAHLEKFLSMNPTNAQNVATAQGLLQALKPKK